jgi:hypothetical protein
MAKASTKKPAAKNDNGISAKGQGVLDYLAKQKAISAASAIERGKVWKACDVGMGVIATLKAKKLMDRHDAEDGTKSYYLLAAGRKLAKGWTMFPMQRKVLNAPVTISYDCRGKRVEKTLPNSYEARAFYARMFKAGRKPAVVYKQAG